MAATYEPIASTTLGSAASSVTFSGIAADWTDLVLVTSDRATDNQGYAAIRFNSDSATNYSYTRLLGYAGGAYSSNSANLGYLPAGTGGTSTTGVFINTIHHIMSYSNGSVFKTVLTSASDPGSSDSRAHRSVALWRSTAAITSVTYLHLYSTFVAGSTFSLYGIKAA